MKIKGSSRCLTRLRSIAFSLLGPGLYRNTRCEITRRSFLSIANMSVRITSGTAILPACRKSNPQRLKPEDRLCMKHIMKNWLRTQRTQHTLSWVRVARPHSACDLRSAACTTVHPRKSGNAAENMGYDCTHDGGARATMPDTWPGAKTRQLGPGVLSSFFGNGRCAEASSSARVAWLSPSYHRLLYSVGISPMGHAAHSCISPR
jgi:hypothetical protein